jgi:cobalt-zinc-cadmium resistance protein CzcA
VVIVAIPGALIGSLVALWFRDMHLSVSAGVGFTSLFGVASMHGVVMISYLEEFAQSKDKDHISALVEGAALRFRPVVMTAVVAILGLLPASLATGIGSDIQRPIATVIVWGLMTSAFITLFVLPVFYEVVTRKKMEPNAP